MKTERIELPRRIGGYAVVKPGQDRLNAITRSIARRIGGGASLHHAREMGRTVTRNTDRVISRDYQLTFVYPEDRRGGGFPVAGEYRMTVLEGAQ